jgi:hypothetical protein
VIGFHWHSHLHDPNPTGVASLSLDGAVASVQDVHTSNFGMVQTGFSLMFHLCYNLYYNFCYNLCLRHLFTSFHYVRWCLCANLELRAKRVSFSSLKTP